MSNLDTGGPRQVAHPPVSHLDARRTGTFARSAGLAGALPCMPALGLDSRGWYVALL